MDEATALARLRRMIAADDEPTLTVAEWQDLLVLARRVDAFGCTPSNVAATPDWAASTAVVAGTIVQQPSTQRWWRALSGGTTAASVTWPTYTHSTPTGTLVTDGTVVWEDQGGAWSPTWNLAAAAAEGWLWKAGKSAGKFQFATDGQSFSRNQIAASCREQAHAYRRRAATSLCCSPL